MSTHAYAETLGESMFIQRDNRYVRRYFHIGTHSLRIRKLQRSVFALIFIMISTLHIINSYTNSINTVLNLYMIVEEMKKWSSAIYARIVRNQYI